MADEALHLCINTIEEAVRVFSDGHPILNTQQCQFLVRKLSEMGEILSKFRKLLSASDANVSERPTCAQVPNELLRVLKRARELVSACCKRCKDCKDCKGCKGCPWLMVAVKQGDMQETFAELLHDVHWYMSVLCCIPVTKSSRSRMVFSPSSCNGTLDFIDDFVLSTAAKEDKDTLIVRLKNVVDGGSLPGDEANLAEQLLRLLSKDGSSSSSPLLKVDMKDLPGEEFIGKGGVAAAVKKTTWRGETFAKKIFHEKVHYQQELDGCAGLDHPNVMRLYFCSEDERFKKYALVMEYMPEKDLFNYLKKWRKEIQPRTDEATPFSFTEAVDLMLQAARGLKYIHDKGKSHRDVKSLNILISVVKNSGGGRSYIAKLTDFGLTTKTNTTTNYSTAKTRISTRNWRAPELFKRSDGEKRPKKLRTPKTDVFSFAIVCSEILTGKPPWEDDSNLGSRLKKGERPKLPERTPARLAALIKRCWDLSPLLRPGFPEICQELQYIKLGLLTDDMTILAKAPVVAVVMNESEAQGPWGGEHGGTPFAVPMNESIIKVEVRHNAEQVYGLDVEYNINGKPFKAGFGEVCSPHQLAVIDLQDPIEFLTQIEGTFGTSLPGQGICRVISLTIHTNVKPYGPYGTPGGGTWFKSDYGRIVGFHGRQGDLLDSIGVFVRKD